MGLDSDPALPESAVEPGRVEGEQTPQGRPLIGVLSAELRGWYGNFFLSGIAAGAEAGGADVLWFVGGPLERAASGYCWLYDIAAQMSLCGVIIVGDIALGSDAETIQSFCTRFASVPVVCGGVEAENVSIVLPDSFGGMTRAVNHLIEVHGHQKIAFISGPADQSESRDRYRAYADALERHGIALEPLLVAPGDYSEDGGRKAACQLLDGPLPFEALAAANDAMALGAMQEIHARGMHIPRDIAVVGFDDVEAAQIAAVPLTTVRQPFFDAGRKTAERLLELIQERGPHQKILVPTEVVVRTSCGCLSPAIEEVEVQEGKIGTSGQPLDSRETVDEITRLLEDAACSHVTSALGQAGGLISEPPRQESLRPLVTSFLLDVRNPGQRTFLSAFRAAVQPAHGGTGETALWQSLLSTLRTAVLRHASGASLVVRAENLLHQARIALAETAQSVLSWRRLFRENLERVLAEFDHAVGAVADRDTLSVRVAEHLPALGIGMCSLVLFETAPDEEDLATFPGVSTLVFSYDDGRALARPSRQRFPTIQLLPDGLLAAQQCRLKLVEPLFFGGRQLGYIVVGTAHCHWEVYAQLREILSSALFRFLLEQLKSTNAELEERVAERTRELERRNAELQAANRAIEQLARTDPLTGLFNRRVLEEELRQEAERARRSGSALSAIAIDLDKFKRVNDTWGHATGDRLLTAVGRVLQTGIRKYDLAVRTGGEELLVLLPGTSIRDAQRIAERIRKQISELVVEGLPEKVTASAGVAAFAAGESEDAFLSRADAALYEAKRTGRDRVVCAPGQEEAVR